jgi:hypothetical protein
LSCSSVITLLHSRVVKSAEPRELSSPGREGAEIRFREILCAILNFIIPFTKSSPPPPIPFLPPTLTDYLFSPPNVTTHITIPHYLSFCFSTPPFFLTDNAIRTGSLFRQVWILIFEQRQRLYPFKKRAMCSFDSHEYWFNCTSLPNKVCNSI